jgi:RimJ/RimL family protein N-acetyltransferase
MFGDLKDANRDLSATSRRRTMARVIKLQTARLRLREMNEADAVFLLEVLNEPAFLRNIGDRGVRTPAEAAGYLEERITSSYARFGFGMWLVELVETDEAIGICGLIKRDALADADLGFSFLERHWGSGFAFEAAVVVADYAWKVVKLPRLLAIVAPGNAASIRLVGKLGFRFEKSVQITTDGPELILFAAENPNQGK